MNTRDAFGRLIVPPERLPLHERLLILRQLAGELQASADESKRWLGRALGKRLAGEAASLEQALDLTAPPRSRRTVANLMKWSRRDSVLLLLSRAAGSDAKALRMVRGEVPVTAEAARLIALLPDRRAGSAAAFTRARRRLLHMNWRSGRNANPLPPTVTTEENVL